MKRRLAREIAVQCLYQLGMNEVSPREAMDMALEEALNDNESGFKINLEEWNTSYLEEIVQHTHHHEKVIDGILASYLQGWHIDRLSRVDREILRLASYEMLFGKNTPPKVIVNEAIELAKLYGTEESAKFVNGVLGKMIGDLLLIKERINQPK